MANRYMKGRLPEGVDFAAYPGRSSTPLPTAESKSAERINQLKIWNEAATNDDNRRLNASKAKGANVSSAAATRRTDSFKDAKDRHSASFHGATPANSSDPKPVDHSQRSAIRTGGLPLPANNDIFADRSDSESDEEAAPINYQPDPPSAPDPAFRSARGPDQAAKKAEQMVSSPPTAPAKANISAVAPAIPQPTAAAAPLKNPSATEQAPPRPEPKQSKGCCVIM